MRIAGLILVCLALASAGRAQAPVAPPGAGAVAEIEQARDDLRQAGAGMRTRPLSDAEIKARLADIAPIQTRIAGALAVLTPQLDDANARVAQLGPPPGANQPPEDPQTVATRHGLARSRQKIDDEVKEARLLSLEADQTSADLAERLRHNFSVRLWTRSQSILDPGLWREFAAAAPADLARLAKAADEEAVRFADAARRPAPLVLAALAGFLLLGPARWLLNRFAHSWAERKAASPLRRSALALILVLIAVLTPLAAGAGLRATFMATGALTPAFAHLAGLLVRVVVFAALLEGLGRAALSPGRPAWRLAPIPDDIARRLAPYPGLIGVTAGLATFVAGLNSALGSSLSSSVTSDCCTMLIELVAVGATLAMTARAREAHLAAPRPARGRREAASRLPWVVVTLFGWLAVAAALIAVLIGYLALASFLMRETVWIGAVLASLFLLLRFVDELFPRLFSPEHPLGRVVGTALGLSRGAMEQIGVLASGLARLALLLFGWAAILAPFGASAEDIVSRVTSADIVFHLGKVAISPGAILGGVALFFVGLAVTRGVRGWLEVRYLPKTRLDVGLRTSVAAAVTYFGAVIAILVTFAYLGLSFSQIALFASALSVGIGFGLQSIIGNFVSGLILLAERPIAVGDWIAIGELEGDVRRINIRATEIEMMDKSRLIVPNSDLVTKTVRNVTHSGAVGRVRLVLKLDDAADPGEVRTLVLARLGGHEDVLKEPPPAVYLSDVKDGALEFTAFAYLASPRLAFRVKSELLFQIVPDLKARSIALANSTPIINVGVPDRPIEPAPGA